MYDNIWIASKIPWEIKYELYTHTTKKYVSQLALTTLVIFILYFICAIRQEYTCIYIHKYVCMCMCVCLCMLMCVCA